MSGHRFRLELADLATFNVDGPPALGTKPVLVIGPAGPPQPPLTITAGKALGGHRGVLVRGDGQVWLASPGDPDVDATIGVTLGATEQGALATVQRLGEVVEAGWAWVPGLPVWLGEAGVLTQALPQAGALLRIGTATAATRLFVDPRLIAKL